MKDPRLLIIDDDAVMRQTLAGLLSGSGYEIYRAGSGKEGIEMAFKVNPDVILLDIMMPGMDGFEVCRFIRKDVQMAEVPIIMVTALDDRESRLRGLEAGADDFLSKPFDSMELDIRLRNLKRVARFRHLLDERNKLRDINILLQQQNDELKLLSRKVIDVQENERRRLAMDLHDEIGQQLTVLKLLLENPNAENDNDLRLNWEKALTMINELLHLIRELSIDLRPSVLDDLGLVAALDWLIKRYSRRTNVQVIHNLNPLEERRFPDLIETTTFRFVQEALTNVARHAGVSEAMVTLDIAPNLLQVLVLDSGKGFDINRIPPGNSTGISGMRERVMYAGGTFHLQSTPGEGTMVQAEFPLLEVRENVNYRTDC